MSTITSIRVTPQELRIGKQRWYYDTSVQILPENADCSYVNWSSSDASIATVNSAGHIYTKKAGNVMIIASACDGSGASDFVDLFVKDSIDVRTIQFDKTKLTIKNGSSVIPEYTVTPSNAGDQTVTFTSGNTSIATVTNGTINAVGVGETTITATANDGGGAKKTFRLIVTEGEPVTSVTVTPEAATLYVYRNESGELVGDSMTLSKEVLPSNAANKNIVWESTDTNVATVDRLSGTVTATGVGVAQIFARAQDGSEEFGYCVVEVKNVLVTCITVSPLQKTIVVDACTILNKTIHPLSAVNKVVRWVSTNENIVSVDEMSGCVIGKNPGTAEIRAIATDGSGVFGSCEITVNNLSDVNSDSWEHLGFKYDESQRDLMRFNKGLPPYSYENWILNGRQKALYIVDHSGIAGTIGAGHARLLIRSDEGRWYRTEFVKNPAAEDVIIEYYEISESEKEERTSGEEINYVCLCGNYMPSLERAKEISENANNTYNGQYDLIINNCLDYVQEILKCGDNVNDAIDEYIATTICMIPQLYYDNLVSLINS